MSEKPEIKIGHLRITDHLILGVTKNKLETEEEHFKYSTITTVPMIGWNQISDGIAKGKLDGAFMLAPIAFVLQAAGIDVKLVLFTHRDGSVLVKARRANIEKIEDFRGKTIIIPYKYSIHHMLLHIILKKHGLTPGIGKDLLLEELAPMQIIDTLRYDQDGDIGGFFVAEPFASECVKEDLGEEFVLSSDIWKNHPCCVFVVREEIIQKYPEALYEITKSLVQSGQFVEEKRKESVMIGSYFLDQKPKVMERVLLESNDRITTNKLYPDPADIERIQNYMHDEMHILETKVDIEKLVDTRFAKEANAK